MSDHVVMPALRVAALPAAFDLAWLQGAASHCRDWASNRLDVASTTHAAARLRAQLGTDAAPSGMDTGETMQQHVRRVYLTPALMQWREAARAEGLDPAGDANRARREQRAKGSDASPGITNEDHPAVAAALALIPDMSTVREGMLAQFASSSYLLRSFGPSARAPDVPPGACAPDVDRTVNLIDPHALPSPRAGSNARAMGERSFPSALQADAPPLASSSSGSTLTTGGVVECETLLQVRLYHRAGHKLSEFLMLASHTLTQLRDCIKCSMDADTGAGAYFYIDGVVYTDMRASLSPDDGAAHKARKRGRLSGAAALAALLQADLDGDDASPLPLEPPAAAPLVSHALGANVVQWSQDALCQGTDTGWGPLQLASMDTPVSSLAVRLGAHYLYAHADNCEHILVFVDARLLSSTADAGALDASMYPRQVFQARAPRQRRCDVCAREYASLALYGDCLTASNPSVVCATCFRVMHGDPDAVGDEAAAADAHGPRDYRVIPLRPD